MDQQEIVVVMPDSGSTLVDFVPVITAVGVIVAACIALAGVFIAQKKQGQQAHEDRKNALTLAREERVEQEKRAQREWFREKQFDAFTRLLDATHQVNRYIQDPVHKHADAMDALDRAVTAAKAVTTAKNIRETLQTAMEELWKRVTKGEIGASAKLLGLMQFIAYGEIHKYDESHAVSNIAAVDVSEELVEQSIDDAPSQN